MESKRKMSVGVSFAAGALFGAIAVFVPFVSAGHPRTASRPAAESSGKPAAAAPAASKKDAVRDSKEASSDASCDVQLD